MTEVENAVGSLIQCYTNTAHLLRNPRIFEETEDRIADEHAKATEARLARSTYKLTLRDKFTILWHVLFAKPDVWLGLLEFVYFMVVRVPKEVYSGNLSLILLERRVNRNVNRIAVCNLYHSLEKDTKKKDAVSK